MYVTACSTLCLPPPASLLSLPLPAIERPARGAYGSGAKREEMLMMQAARMTRTVAG